MNPTLTHAFEPIPAGTLLARVQALREQKYRLVQIGATTLPDQVELTYTFEREQELVNLRLLVPAEATLPSITPIYWGAFLYENELHDLFHIKIDGLAVDFQGNLYQTAVKFPFGSTKPPTANTGTAHSAQPN